jgi:mercuric ion binding protein
MARLLAAWLFVSTVLSSASAQPAPVRASTPRQGQRIVVAVRGMVCAFCAQGLDKIFKDEASVEKVEVSLDLERLDIQLKPGGTLDDARIRKLVGDAGFDVLQVDRTAP